MWSRLFHPEKRKPRIRQQHPHTLARSIARQLFLFLLLSFLKDSVSFEAIKLSSFIIFRIVAVG